MAGNAKPIGIDIRSLQYPVTRGVFSYSHSIIEAMIAREGVGAFSFFSAGRHPLPDFLKNKNLKNIHFPWPTKVLSAGMRFFGSPTIDGLLETKNIFMPNLDYWSVGVRTRLTVTVHDLSFLVDSTWFTPRERMKHRLINIKGLLRRADAIITLSEHTKCEIIELLDIDENKIHHIAPGVPPLSFPSPSVIPTETGIQSSSDTRLPARGGLSREGDKILNRVDFNFPYILFLGAIEPRKNIVGALAAFELLTQKNKDIHFVLAGHRPTHYSLLTTPSSDRIHFLGQVTPEQKSALLCGAKALFFPSLYEGFGFPAVEAMSVGVPVVASSAGALPETIGNAGLLLDPMDTSGFANALDEILSNNDLRQRLIMRGYEQIKNLSWERCAEETLRVINNKL